MSTTSKPLFRRNLLNDQSSEKTCSLLQDNLVNLIDLALLLKQAHWNVVGANFRSVHLQLDDIIESARSASDEVAERISAFGIVPDGRSETISDDSDLESYPARFVSVQETIERAADAVKATIERLRNAVNKLGDIDPVSQDLLIGITGTMEKHLWMLQAQEIDRPE